MFFLHGSYALEQKRERPTAEALEPGFQTAAQAALRLGTPNSLLCGVRKKIPLRFAPARDPDLLAQSENLKFTLFSQ